MYCAAKLESKFKLVVLLVHVRGAANLFIELIMFVPSTRVLAFDTLNLSQPFEHLLTPETWTDKTMSGFVRGRDGREMSVIAA